MARNNEFNKKVDQTIGRNVYKMRMLKGWTREFLSEKMGVTQQQLRKYENGIDRISGSRLVAVANAFSISIDKLCNRISPEEDVAINRVCMNFMNEFNAIKDTSTQSTLRSIVSDIVRLQG